MTQYELMEKIIEKLNKGGIYNALELADIFNISIEKVAITCRILESIEKIEMNDFKILTFIIFTPELKAYYYFAFNREIY